MLKFAVGPCQAVRGWLQLSGVLPPLELVVGCDCSTGWVKVGILAGREPGVSEVEESGNGRGVLLGGRVGLAVSVGGTGVAVGTASCVSATIVSAAASAVC